jgi:hypothetical protein
MKDLPLNRASLAESKYVVLCSDVGVNGFMVTDNSAALMNYE